MGNFIVYSRGELVGPYGCKYIEDSDPFLVTRKSGRGVGQVVKHRRILFECGSCGGTGKAILFKVKKGEIKSCGCQNRTSLGFSVKGKSEHRIYRIWRRMIERCHAPGHRQYKDYGERGIFVCSEWRNDFQTFYQWALSNGARSGLHIDRRNNEDGYTPENCRFVTPKVNSNNTRATRYCMVDGEVMCFQDAIDRVSGLSAQKLWRWDKGVGLKTKPKNLSILPKGTYIEPKR